MTMEPLDESELCFPQFLNASCKRIQRPYAVTIFIYIGLTSFSVLTATLNLLVITSISHYKQLHTPTNLLLCSLAVSDFSVAFLMSFQIVLIDGCWFLGEFMCAVYYVSDSTFTSASIGNMVLISVDRYIAICDPLHYTTKVTQKKVRICVCLCWACSVLYNCVRLQNNLKHVSRFNTCIGQCVVAILGYIAGLFDLLLSFIVPVTVTVVLYFRVFVVVVTQSRAVQSLTAAATLQCSAKKSELKAAWALGVLVIVYLICTCPYFFFVLTGQDKLINASSFSFTIWLFYLNSCLNPMIYAFYYTWFRKAVKLILTLQTLKSNSSKTNLL